ncbi:hypothetical protein ACFWYW_57110 [Nonomuraea sp. NPDC059023]|uniref:hypothetical protein n=1 Tax=unclassified Nonomuraea TaxID=2593643 RepID=UPI0036AC74F2
MVAIYSRPVAQRTAGISWEEIGAQLDIAKQPADAKFAETVEEWETAVQRPEVVEEWYGITGGLEAHPVNRMPDGWLFYTRGAGTFSGATNAKVWQALEP